MKTFTGDLHPHQADGLSALLTNPRLVLADDVGLGKTVQAAALVGSLHDDKALPAAASRLPVLYVTAPGLVAQTTEELRRFLPSLEIVSSVPSTADGKAEGPAAKGRAVASEQAPDVIVTHHDLAHRRSVALRARTPYLVIIDEASALKGGGVRFVSHCDIADLAERVVVMTATPQENHPMDLWSILRLAGLPQLHSRETFGERYCTWRDIRRRQRPSAPAGSRPVTPRRSSGGSAPRSCGAPRPRLASTFPSPFPSPRGS